MTSFSVSTTALREQARILRTLLDERKAAHQSMWGRLSGFADELPSDLRSSHEIANVPWNSELETLYENYYQIALCMEAAADAYERDEKDIQISLTQT